MSTAERDPRTPPASDKVIRAVHLCLERTRQLLARAEQAVAKSYQATKLSHELLAGSLSSLSAGNAKNGPARLCRLFSQLVSQPALGRSRCGTPARRAKAWSGASWHELHLGHPEDQPTNYLFRAEEVAKATDDRAAAVLREHEAR